MAQKPSYIAYAVTDTGEGNKSRWRAIGAAFRNRDNSLTVALDALPHNGRLILQEPKDNTDSPMPTDET